MLNLILILTVIWFRYCQADNEWKDDKPYMHINYFNEDAQI